MTTFLFYMAGSFIAYLYCVVREQERELNNLKKGFDILYERIEENKQETNQIWCDLRLGVYPKGN